MVFFAWRKANGVGRCLEASLSVLAAVAMQALDAAGRQVPPPLRGFAAEIRAVFPPAEGVRRLGPDFEMLARRFADDVFDATRAGAAAG